MLFLLQIKFTWSLRSCLCWCGNKQYKAIEPNPSTSPDSHTYSNSISHSVWEAGVPTDVDFKMTRVPKGMGLEGNATLPAMCLHWTWVAWCIISPMKPHPGKLVQTWKDRKGKQRKWKIWKKSKGNRPLHGYIVCFFQSIFPRYLVLSPTAILEE